MTLDELKQHDGRDGRKAYVAVSGKIYDVSASPLWQNGNHQDIHQAGHDMSEELKSAPHVRSVIERFPVVGNVTEAVPAPTKPVPWIWLAAGIILAVVVVMALL